MGGLWSLTRAWSAGPLPHCACHILGSVTPSNKGVGAAEGHVLGGGGGGNQVKAGEWAVWG